MLRVLLLGMVSLGAAPLIDSNPIVGTWKVTYPAGTRVENGEQSVILGTGTLTIQAQADSLFGELVPDPVPDLPAQKPTRMTGLAGNGPVALVAHLAGMVEVNGARRLVTFTSTWQLEARGDSLVGTLSHQVEDAGVMTQDPGPVRGVRARP
jgi:hypothetical protein